MGVCTSHNNIYTYQKSNAEEEQSGYIDIEIMKMIMTNLKKKSINNEFNDKTEAYP